MSVPPNPRDPAPTAATQSEAGAAAPIGVSLFRRYPKIFNALFGALCLYVALIWLLALDQKFHWGIFAAKPPSLP